MNNQIKPDVLISQIPGGMLSNLVAQLRQQKAEDKLEAVLAEMPHVRKDLGYPPLVTPTSQMVGAQAALNVMTGKRYSVVAMETPKLCHGAIRRSAGQDRRGDQRKGARAKKNPIPAVRADLLKPGLEKALSEAGSMAKSEEDVLTYALFPEIARITFCTETVVREDSRQLAKPIASFLSEDRYLSPGMAVTAKIILFSGYSIIPTAPASINFGIRSRTLISSRTLSTEIR